MLVCRSLWQIPDRPGDRRGKLTTANNRLFSGRSKMNPRLGVDDMMAELFFISQAVRSSTTNDRLRKLFVEDMPAHIRNFRDNDFVLLQLSHFRLGFEYDILTNARNS